MAARKLNQRLWEANALDLVHEHVELTHTSNAVQCESQTESTCSMSMPLLLLTPLQKQTVCGSNGKSTVSKQVRVQRSNQIAIKEKCVLPNKGVGSALLCIHRVCLTSKKRVAPTQPNELAPSNTVILGTLAVQTSYFFQKTWFLPLNGTQLSATPLDRHVPIRSWAPCSSS